MRPFHAAVSSPSTINYYLHSELCSLQSLDKTMTALLPSSQEHVKAAATTSDADQALAILGYTNELKRSLSIWTILGL